MHKLFRAQLPKLGHASCSNLTGQIDDLRSGFGEWLVKERCEATLPPRPAPHRTAPPAPRRPAPHRPRRAAPRRAAPQSPPQPRTTRHSPVHLRASPRISAHLPRYEAASDLSYASNLFVDELSARGALMGMRVNSTLTTRCPLRGAVRVHPRCNPPHRGCNPSRAPTLQPAAPRLQPLACTQAATRRT